MSPSRPPPLCAPPNRQVGMGMISVLIALIILSFGILGLASMYAKTVPMPAQDRMAQRAAAAGQAFWAVLQANPQAFPNVSFNNLAAAPNVLSSWKQQLQSLPGVTAQAQTGNPCTMVGGTVDCSVTLTIQWKQLGGTRTQVFNEQFGF